MKIIAVGDNIIDNYNDQKMMYPGGNALNVAVLSKRYGAEKSSYIGIIGDDEEGKHIEEALVKEDIDITRMRTVVGESGKTQVIVNEEGDRVFHSWNKGGVQSLVKVRFTEEDIAYIKKHDVLHSSVYSYTESDIPLLHEHIAVSFDFSTKSDNKYVERICPYLTFAFFSRGDLSENECLRLIETVHELGTSNVLITRGEKSAFFSNGTSVYEQPSMAIDVIDTLGAGDSFIAKFLINFYQTNNPEASIQKAVEAASETCTYFGAFGYGKPSEQ